VSELVTGFQSLPSEYQQVLLLAQEQHQIRVAPLQTLVGGWSGAMVFLVSVTYQTSQRVEHLILKLDRKSPKARSDELSRHVTAQSHSPSEFARDHLATLAFERVEAESAIAIFYSIAGQSLQSFHPLSKYGQQQQLETIFSATNQFLLAEWNANPAFATLHARDLLETWLGFRLEKGAPIESFLEKNCSVEPERPGFLIQGSVYPNPLWYARHRDSWGDPRLIDSILGLQHGDLNTNNILVKFSTDEKELIGYYLIDFALFKDNMPLLYDLRYLEMSYLTLAMSQVSFAKSVDLILHLTQGTVLDPRRAPIEMAGVSAVVTSARVAFERWVMESYPSLQDDLWGQYWLAGAAAGLTYCHKAGLADEPRLAGLIYAAANLKRYFASFSIPLPTDVELLFAEGQPGSALKKPLDLQSKDAPAQKLPSGTVTFLFTDIEGSTKLSQQYPDQMPALLARHHEILNRGIAAHNGFVFANVGDSFSAAFHGVGEAVQAALDIQRALHKEPWSPAPIKVRMGIHTGMAQLQDSSESSRYSGYATLATSQRIMSAGHGGQILLSRVAADLLGDKLPDGVRLLDRKEQYLKDIAQPVQIYQVSVSDLPSDFPQLRTEEVHRHNLPVQLTAFIGRETELASLHALLSDPNNRLITIVAPGGMGKTRLSLEAAGQMVSSFPQGVYFVALDRITSADMIVQAVVEVLPISLASNEDPKSRVVDYLRDKRILLVMDNFEHVLDGATFMQEVLSAAPQVQVLASSRAKLNLTGETVFHIEGLTISDADVEKNSAVQLFRQSAKRMRPQFDLTEEALPVVTQICHLVGGMPLAIVLAAAWIDSLSVQEIASEIETSIDMLETEKGDVPGRQRSVRAVIESSWNQVDASAQNLVKRLSVFRGGFTRLAAQEAAGASLRGLSQLVDKALLRRDPVTGRYSIHELLRQYAEEQLKRSSQEELSAHEQHAEYFASFMKTCGAHMHDSRQKATFPEIEADIDNIRVAWNYWSDHQNAQYLREFVDAMWIFFEVRGSFAPAIQFFSEAAQKLESNEPEVVCAGAELRARQAWFTALIGLPDQGLRLAQESVSTLRQYSRDISVNILESVNINAIFMNRNEIVVQVNQEMMARADRSGDIWERAWALIWSAYAFVLQHQIREALQTGQEALAIFEKLDNPFGSSVASGIILGSVFMATGNKDAAKEHFLRGMHAAEEINYLRLLQITYDNLGTLALMENDIEQAQHFFVRSLRISQESGQTREMLASLRDLANVSMARGDLDGALKLLAVVLKHPASDQNSLNRPERLRDEAEKLRAQIEAQWNEASYRSWWEMRQNERFAEVVAQILN
jgi:predicted ATPase/class 3 adenylate cyclase